MMTDSLKAYRVNRETLIAEIVAALSADDRFVAAWLTGSFGRNDADAVSDLDVTLVVSDPYSQTLCARPFQISAQTTPERLALISKFGQPAIIHENNYNAPEGGTFTFVMYAASAVMVDWILRPFTNAERPSLSRSLFDRVGIPVSPSGKSDSLNQCIEKATQTIAFFWMMSAVTAKHIFRQDGIFVQSWLEELHRMVREVEHLIEGKTPLYHRGSMARLEPTREGQIEALRRLSDKMQKLMPEVSKLGGYVPPSPMSTIEVLLNMADGE